LLDGKSQGAQAYIAITAVINNMPRAFFDIIIRVLFVSVRGQLFAAQ
jgi:hypothetical protein